MKIEGPVQRIGKLFLGDLSTHNNTDGNVYLVSIRLLRVSWKSPSRLLIREIVFIDCSFQCLPPFDSVSKNSKTYF